MSDFDTNEEFGFDFDQNEAKGADSIADRIVDSGAYVGQFSRVALVISREKGTKGMEFEFVTKEGGKQTMTLWVQRADGSDLFSKQQVQAMMAALGVKSLKTSPGKVRAYSQEESKWVEADGKIFPDLQARDIGLVLQKEIKDGGKFQFNIYAVFDPKTRRTSSEIIEGSQKAVKLDKILHNLKDKDSRKIKETAAPSMGLGDDLGGF